jgi:hypothetical protein
MTIGLLAGAAAGENGSFASDGSIVLLITVLLGINGLLAGATVGALTSPRMVDRRYGPAEGY